MISTLQLRNVIQQAYKYAPVMIEDPVSRLRLDLLDASIKTLPQGRAMVLAGSYEQNQLQMAIDGQELLDSLEGVRLPVFLSAEPGVVHALTAYNLDLTFKGKTIVLLDAR